MMHYEGFTVTNREQFIDYLPELLKQFELHQQIYSNVSITSFLMTLKATVESEQFDNKRLVWEDMAGILEQSLLVPNEVNTDGNL